MRNVAGRMQGELVISSSVTRSQADNLDDAMQRLQDILVKAADSIKPIESNPEKVKLLKKQKRKVWHSTHAGCVGPTLDA
jgi:hypothetical protein